MIRLEKLWRDKHVSINTKKRIVRTLIFPTVLYGCETWTMTKKMEKKINTCEMWIWRKMQRISWTEKKTIDIIGSLVFSVKLYCILFYYLTISASGEDCFDLLIEFIASQCEIVVFRTSVELNQNDDKAKLKFRVVVETDLHVIG